MSLVIGRVVLSAAKVGVLQQVIVILALLARGVRTAPVASPVLVFVATLTVVAAARAVAGAATLAVLAVVRRLATISIASLILAGLAA
mmetsp:Transcript_35425/g.43307  ORF Transcript_35425/g.43307 Transcript_35425/m.43307 type:complete len:88 (+) Transcript_35425:1548-1811(+)|eukprot:CAMPEP_0170472048 /NCGR_PEP_ID=MMETSP0123-20130129/14150_1 /TAXON_ID=182087 /ORGANISM="Favella ehrenbergii, Strain Fehren 1" /LENGTH=87 /DNA_ID=CAMNT_0010740071 /DNA_START=1452 /DNA_END=1715 /DNA_ORIENTATION=+